jgi:hypothetical protein
MSSPQEERKQSYAHCTLSFSIDSETKKSPFQEIRDYTREFHAFTREFRAFTHKFDAFTREFHTFTREFHTFTREFRAFTHEVGAIHKKETALLARFPDIDFFSSITSRQISPR